MSSRCWYVAYGSNMSRERLLCYLQGGCPEGAFRTYDGAADPSPPRDDRPAWLDGTVYFALESKVWGGGIAFLDTEISGRVPARAYLVTQDQLADVFAQESRYEQLFELPRLDGAPAYCFTSPDRLHPSTAPSPAYLAALATGLAEAHGWSPVQIERYLARLRSGLRCRREVC